MYNYGPTTALLLRLDSNNTARLQYGTVYARARQLPTDSL